MPLVSMSPRIDRLHDSLASWRGGRLTNAVAVRITPHKMSKEDYEAAIAELSASGVSEPEGRLFHAAYGDDDVHMFEVWESAEQFESHRVQTLAILQGTTLGTASVEVHELHSPRPD
jgi:quinol monooxygenase YgiN